MIWKLRRKQSKRKKKHNGFIPRPRKKRAPLAHHGSARLPDEMWDYAARNRILKRLGFSCYEEYRESKLWCGIRERVLDKYKHQCVCCGAKATQVHHAKYTEDNLSGKRLVNMVAICRGCHERAELRKDGSKASLDEANQHILSATNHAVAREMLESGPKLLLPVRIVKMCRICNERPPMIGDLCGWCNKTAHLTGKG